MGSIFTYKHYTASITTQNLNATTGTATPGSTIGLDASSFGGLSVQVEGTYTGALTIQISNDALTWTTLASNSVLNINTGAFSSNIPSGATGFYQCDITGAMHVRVTALSAVTGTALMNIALIQDSSIVSTKEPTGTSTVAVASSSTGGWSYAHYTAAQTATSVKNTAGTLHAIIVNTPVASGTLEYDDANSHTNAMGIITYPATLVSDGPQEIILDAAFATGLNITSTGTMDFTILYK